MLRKSITRFAAAAAAAATVAATITATVALPTPAGAAAPATAAADTPSRERAPYRITPFRPTAGDNPRLVRAWRTWQDRDDHRRYTTVFRTSCFCGPEPIKDVETVVRGRRVTSVTHVDRTRELARPGHEIDAVYAMLREYYATADEVVVRYRNGVPRQIAVDRIAEAIDDEVYYAVGVRLQP